MNREVICFDAVAPVRERGLKFDNLFVDEQYKMRRSREGAWIEIVNGASALASQYNVAPVRERGLKYLRSKKNEKK